MPTVLPDGTVWHCPQPADALMIWREIFEENVYAAAAETVAPSGTILDVGANTGLSTLYFGRQLPQARIIAFEPAAILFADLQANLRAHAVMAEAQPYAVGAAEEIREFTYYPNAPSQSGLYADRGQDDQLTRAYLLNSGMNAEEADFLCADLHTPVVESVRIVTLSAVIRERGIEWVDLLKIDVERAELDVLHGIADNDWPRINAVIMEVHDTAGRAEACTRLLESHRLRVAVHQEQWLKGSELFTILARR